MSAHFREEPRIWQDAQVGQRSQCEVTEGGRGNDAVRPLAAKGVLRHVYGILFTQQRCSRSGERYCTTYKQEHYGIRIVFIFTSTLSYGPWRLILRRPYSSFEPMALIVGSQQELFKSGHCCDTDVTLVWYLPACSRLAA